MSFNRLTKIISAFICFGLLQSCSQETVGYGSDSIGLPTVDSFELAMNQYSKRVVAKTNGSISNPTSPEKTTDMPSYVVRYTINDDALKTKDDASTNRTSYAINVGITTAWSQAFCTDELKSIMRKYDIKMVTGQLVLPDGEKQSMSPCMD